MLQVEPAGQFMLHAPQFVGSFCVSVHRMPQSI